MAQAVVLVVDSNPQTARRVEDVLEGSAYGVAVARDASEAATLAEAQEVAVVLTSISMPRGNGYELVRAIRERHPSAIGFLLTGGFEVINRNRAESAGVHGQISRPVSLEALRSALEPVLGSLDGVRSAVVEAPPAAPPPPDWRPTTSNERVATFLPRDKVSAPRVSVDPAVVGPAMEAAILEVLPEVVEALLRRSLDSSTAFRSMVETAVDEVVRERLPAMLTGLVQERLAEIQARSQGDAD
jgi:CheY-like chemotaxis protein